MFNKEDVLKSIALDDYLRGLVEKVASKAYPDVEYDYVGRFSFNENYCEGTLMERLWGEDCPVKYVRVYHEYLNDPEAAANSISEENERLREKEKERADRIHEEYRKEVERRELIQLATLRKKYRIEG